MIPATTTIWYLIWKNALNRWNWRLRKMHFNPEKSPATCPLHHIMLWTYRSKAVSIYLSSSFHFDLFCSVRVINVVRLEYLAEFMFALWGSYWQTKCFWCQNRLTNPDRVPMCPTRSVCVCVLDLMFKYVLFNILTTVTGTPSQRDRLNHVNCWLFSYCFNVYSRFWMKSSKSEVTWG